MKFAEAAEVRDKINQLKTLEEEKAKDELRKLHDDEKNQLDLENQEETRAFNKQYDNYESEIKKKFEDLFQMTKEQQRNEMEGSYKEFIDSFTEKNPKASPEILDLHRKLQGIVKRKE
jgi:hypothetical protein